LGKAKSKATAKSGTQKKAGEHGKKNSEKFFSAWPESDR
jgi:hypothetical protein